MYNTYLTTSQFLSEAETHHFHIFIQI